MCTDSAVASKDATGAPEADDISPEIISGVGEAVSFWLSENWTLILDGAMPAMRELAHDLQPTFCKP
jgi:hypothetical protein